MCGCNATAITIGVFDVAVTVAGLETVVAVVVACVAEFVAVTAVRLSCS